MRSARPGASERGEEAPRGFAAWRSGTAPRSATSFALRCAVERGYENARMSGSRSRRRRKRAAAAKRDGKTVATRAASEAVRRKPVPVAAATQAPAPVAKAAPEPDVAALEREIRALKRALATAEEKANDADAKRSRAVNRATAALRRENETLEAQLTLLVQEIGQIKHLIDRVPMLETELRVRDMKLAELEQSWLAERKQLEAEVAKLRSSSGRGTGSKTAMAAAAAAAAGARLESVR